MTDDDKLENALRETIDRGMYAYDVVRAEMGDDGDPDERRARFYRALREYDERKVALEFEECATCADKPGPPVLCRGCLHNRATIANLTRLRKIDEHFVEYARELIDELGNVLPPDTLRTATTMVAAVQHWKDVAGASLRAFNDQAAEIKRMRPVYELARRWCNRPVSCLADGATVLANDADMFARLHALFADDTSPPTPPAPKITSGKDFKWGTAHDAAEMIVKQCNDARYIPPEATEMHRQRARVVCEQIDKLAAALKLQPGTHAQRLAELEELLFDLDQEGGLGQRKHDQIRAALGSRRADIAAERARKNTQG
jgi:hypothetical protein